MNTRAKKLPPVKKLLPRKENIPRPTLQHKRNFALKGNTTVVRPKSAYEKSVESTENTVLLPVDKSPQETRRDLSHAQRTILPPISDDCQNSQSSQKTSHQHTGQEPGASTKNKPFHEGRPASKEEPGAATPGLSPEAALRDSQLYLTDFELEEIKEYKQVWYLGQEATKARSSKAAEPQNTKSFNFGYDTKDGFYKAIINDHLAFRFEILGVIGAGYSGQVLKCMDHKNMELVAVKVIRNKKSVNELGKAEIKILEVLRELDKNNTANIVHMKESFYFRNHLCITFELFEKDLYRAIKGSKHHGLSEKAVKNYTIDVLKCLQLLRKKRVVHGDLKPDNILLYKHGSEKRAAVCDFGGSYFMKHRDQPVIHTLYYISPEMLLGKRCGPATDMWSLGCTVAELHLGRRLFRGCDTADHFCCIMKVLGVPPPELLIAAPKRHNFFQSNGVPLKDTDIRQHSSTLPRQLNSKNTYFVDFIKCCLEYNPTKRITPEEALKHPWLHKKDAKPVKSAGRTRSDTTVPCTNKKPTLLRREKVPPITKPKGKKGGN